MASEIRRKPQELTLVLKERVRETHDTSTLVFEKPAGAPPYLAGQFLTLDPHQFLAVRPWVTHLESVKGKKELARAYSLSSAPHEEDLAVTVKEEPFVVGYHPYPPLLSPFLVHGIAPGAEVKAVCFTGPYVLPPDIEQRTDHVLHVVAGSGSIPNFSIVKHALHAHPALRHTFLYSNKTWDDVCFRDALAGLEAGSGGRLNVIHTLTREPDTSRFGAKIRQGRIDQALLQELIADPQRVHAYVCGPAITAHERRAALTTGVPAKPRFLETTLDFLERAGIPKAQIRREAYG